MTKDTVDFTLMLTLIQENNHEMKSLRVEVREGMNSVRHRLDSLQSDLSFLHTRIDRHETALERINTTLGIESPIIKD